MNRKEYTVYVAVVSAIMGALVGGGAVSGNVVLTLVGVILGMALILVGKRRLTEIIEDERIYRVSEKASRRTLQIFASGAAILGVILISLKSFVEIGYTLSFSVCILLAIYLIFYSCYNRRGLE